MNEETKEPAKDDDQNEKPLKDKKSKKSSDKDGKAAKSEKAAEDKRGDKRKPWHISELKDLVLDFLAR